MDKRWDPITQGLDMLVPVRSVRSNPYSISARTSSLKNDASLDDESLLEFDLLTILEWDSRIERFGVQPVTFRWRDSKGHQKSYTPDVFVRYHYLALKAEPRLKHTIVEVKPREVLKRDWAKYRSKFRAAVAICRLNGLRFKILTEREIRTPLLKNVLFLKGYQGASFTTAHLDERDRMRWIEVQMRRLGVTTPAALLKVLNPDPDAQARYLPWVWFMVNCQTIKCDLMQPLTMATPIWLHGVEAPFHMKPRVI